MLNQLAPLLMSLLGSDVGATVRRTGRNAALYAVAALFFLTAYGALVAGVIVYMMQEYSAVAAMVVVGLMALVLAVAVVAVILGLNRQDRQRAKSESGKAMLRMAAVGLLPVVLRSPVLTSAAVLGGLALLMARPGDGPSSDDT